MERSSRRSGLATVALVVAVLGTALAAFGLFLPPSPEVIVCEDGVCGPAGPAGPEGPAGQEGPAGEQGIEGECGPEGPAGEQGECGPEGPQGPEGPEGSPGEQGEQGAQGECGPPGPEGPPGEQGSCGPEGAQGPAGPAGPQGPIGLTGPEGPRGETGPQGPAGGFGAYGSFYDTGDHQLVQGVPRAIPLNTEQFYDGVRIVDGYKITMSRSGKYNIAFSTQLWNKQNQRHTVTIWLSKNGTAPSNWVGETSTDIYMGTTADAERDVAAWNFFVDAQAGDFFALMVVTDGTQMWLHGSESVNYNATTLPLPFIPSTILTVNQVG